MADHDRVHQLYASMSDAELIESSSAGPEAYTAEAWSVITREIGARGLDNTEVAARESAEGAAGKWQLRSSEPRASRADRIRTGAFAAQATAALLLVISASAALARHWVLAGGSLALAAAFANCGARLRRRGSARAAAVCLVLFALLALSLVLPVLTRSSVSVTPALALLFGAPAHWLWRAYQAAREPSSVATSPADSPSDNV